MKAFIGNRRNFAGTAAILAVAVVAVVAAVPREDGMEALAANAPAAQGRPVTIVQLTASREMDFNESISSDGAIKSRFYSLVSPRISGIIDDIHVREGHPVSQNETKLFQVDNEKLRQEVEHAEQALVIAKSTLDEKQASLIKAEADVRQAEKDFARTRSLYEQKVVPLAEYEVDETRVIQLRAQLKVAQTNVTLAEQNVTLSEISLAMTHKDLRDSVMYSPIDGVVSGRFAEPGEMGTPDKAILRIDDTRQLKAAAYLPAQFYPQIKTGSSIALVTVLGKEIGEFPITYKAPAIDSALRTFEVWADVPGDGEYSVPGAQCVIKVILKESRGVGVPRDAIQFRDSRYWVFVPDDGAAKKIEVKPGLETGGWTELVDPTIKAGDRVITQGQFLLEDGYPIRERGK